MKARNGKIARLPVEIRDQLNARLADGEPGNRLVEWLNSNPGVMKVMAEQFEGRPITDGNLSEWRAGGYEEWLTLRAFLDETRVVSENAGDIADTGISSDHLRIVLLAQHAHLFQNLGIMPKDEFNHRLNAVKKLTASIMNMQRAELQKARLELQRERFELQRERFELQRERFEFQREKQSMRSAASFRAAASTSARAGSSDGRPSAQPRVSPSGPSIPPTADPHAAHSAESPAHPLAAPPSESESTVSPGSGRIHPDSPLSGPRLPVSQDSLECTARTRPPEMSRSASCMDAGAPITSTQPSRLAA